MALGAAPASAHTSPQHLSVGHGRRAIVEDANSWLPGSDPSATNCRRLTSATVSLHLLETGYAPVAGPGWNSDDPAWSGAF